MADVGIKVTGLKEVRRALKKSGADMKQLSALHRHIADMVQDEQQRLAPGSLGSDIRAKGTRTFAEVAGGRTKPYFRVQEFGGSVLWHQDKPRGSGYTRVPIHGGFAMRAMIRIPVKKRKPTGYFFYEGARRSFGRVWDYYTRELDQLIARNFGGTF